MNAKPKETLRNYATFVFGVVFLTVTIIGSVTLLDHYGPTAVHDVISNTPIVKDVVQAANLTWDSLISWFSGSDKDPGGSGDSASVAGIGEEVIESPTVIVIKSPFGVAKSEFSTYFPDVISRTTAQATSESDHSTIKAMAGKA